MEDNVGEEKEDVKRKSRNLSEKKRRDQFNLLINELATMVSINSRKMDKSAVLKATISCLKNQKDVSAKAQHQEIREDWQPSFLSNEEFTHLMLEALDGFIMTLTCSGRILYTSESITALLGYLPCEVGGSPLCDLIPADEQDGVLKFLSNASLGQTVPGLSSSRLTEENRERHSIALHVQRGLCASPSNTLSYSCPVYEQIHLTGYFERYRCPSEDGLLEFSGSEAKDSAAAAKMSNASVFPYSPSQQDSDSTKIVFVAICRLDHPQLLREMIIVEPTKIEFTSRHSLEWKFLFLDHRATAIIGYLPLEVLGTSGYDYYHADDLEKLTECHELLMKQGKGTSCSYRFLTKGQQWIWLQTQYHITYHQWNSNPEFIVCTNTVISYGNIRNAKKAKDEAKTLNSVDHEASILSISESRSNAQTALPESCSLPVDNKDDCISISDNDGSSCTRAQYEADITLGCHSYQRHQQALQNNPHKQSLYVSLDDVLSQKKKSASHPSDFRMDRSSDLSHLTRLDTFVVESCPSSSGSHTNQRTCYSTPVAPYVGSSGKSLRRTRSELYNYSSGSSESNCSSPEYHSKKSRLPLSSRRHHFRGLNNCRMRQHEEYGPLSSFHSDLLTNSHGSHVSRTSIQEFQSDQFVTCTGQNNREWMNISGTLSHSLQSSHVSRDLMNQKPAAQFTIQPSDGSVRGVSNSNSWVLPSQSLSAEYQSHVNIQQRPQQQEEEKQQQNFASNAHQGGYNGINQNFLREEAGGQLLNIRSSEASPTTQEVQVEAAPFLSVIPIQPVFTNPTVRVPSSPTKDQGLCQSLVLSPKQQQLQEQLQQKHSELQQHILRQQEELREVNEQLVMAQYGMSVQLQKASQYTWSSPNVGISVSPPYHDTPAISYSSNITDLRSGATDVTIQHSGGITLGGTSSVFFSQNQDYVSQSTFGGMSHLPISSSFDGSSAQAVVMQGMAIPCQLPQHQAQMLFTPPSYSASNSSL